MHGGNSLREEQPRARASLVKWHGLGLGEEEGCQFIVGALVPASGSLKKIKKNLNKLLELK